MSDKPGARQTRRDVLLLPIAAASMAIKPGRGLAQASAVSDLQSDERVDLYTTAARLDADGGTWLVPIHGRVWRPVRSHTRKAVIAAALRAGYSVAPDRQSQMRFDDRIDLLLADNKGGRRIVVEILGQRHALPASAADGHVTGTLRIAAGDIGPVPAPRAIDVDVVLTPRDPRKFTGSVLAVPPTGRSIISDIDDTVKVTNVLDTAAMLRATFVEPFQAVDGMARALRSWVADGAALHFVSSTPWHLSDPLADFLERAGFPKATLSLKKIRLKDSSIQNILADATVTKPPEIAALRLWARQRARRASAIVTQ